MPKYKVGLNFMDEIIDADTLEDAMQILADRLKWQRDFYADKIKEKE